MKMIEPSRLVRMWGRMAFVTFMGPTKLVFMSLIIPSALEIHINQFYRTAYVEKGNSYPSSSLAPYVIVPALLTKTSMRPHTARASSKHCCISAIGDVTSRAKNLSLSPSIVGS